MSRERLFERIANWGLDRERSRAPRFESVYASVLAHLRCVLNTRMGSVPIDEEYGVPDLSNIAGSFEAGTVDDVGVAVLEAIVRSEPRLLRPRVQVHEDIRELASISLDVSGTIIVEDRSVAVNFRILVKGSGEVAISQY